MRVGILYQEQIWMLTLESQILWRKEHRFTSDARAMQGSHPGRDGGTIVTEGHASPLVLLHHPRCASSLFKFNSRSKMAIETLVRK